MKLIEPIVFSKIAGNIFSQIFGNQMANIVGSGYKMNKDQETHPI